jgi:hypothetical protein
MNPTVTLATGVHTITLTVTDNDGLTDTDTVIITVEEQDLPPNISSPSEIVSFSDATITWTTNEASTSQVEYGLSNAYGQATTLDSNLVTSHSVTLTNLTSSSIYHYRVKSNDAADNEAVSQDFTFTTSVPPNGTPATSNDDLSIIEDGGTYTINVLANDSDPEGDTLTITSITQPSSGTSAIVNAAATLSYSPAGNFYGTDSFTYTVSDGNNGTSTATVNITIASVNDAPITIAIPASLTKNEGQSITAAEIELAADIDSGNLTYTYTGLTTALPHTFGSEDAGSYTLSVAVSDGIATVNKTVNITVANVNLAPVAANTTLSLDEDATATVTISATDPDADGSIERYAIVTLPQNGTLKLNAANVAEVTLITPADIQAGNLKFTPDPDYNGSSNFTFKAYDGAAWSGQATAAITVNPVNDTPVITAMPAMIITNEGQQIAAAQVELATDIDGDTLTYTYSDLANQIPYTFADDEAGSYTLTVNVSDGTETVTKDINVTVNSVAPTVIETIVTKFAVEIVFSEAVNDVLASEIANYTISNGILADSVQLDLTHTRAILATSSHSENIDYTIDIANITDLADAVMAPVEIAYNFDAALAGFWQFDDTSGTTALDTSGNDYTAALTGGLRNTSLSNAELDGTDDAVRVPTNAWNVDKSTLLLWARPTDLSSSSFIFGHTTSTDSQWENAIQLYADQGALCLDMNGFASPLTNIAPLVEDAWHHIALTWDSTNYALYVNGIEEATGTYTALTALNTFAEGGNSGKTSYRIESFKGTIDDIRIHDRALTAAEVLNLSYDLIGDKSVRENKRLSFSVNAYDIDGNPIDYTATVLDTDAGGNPITYPVTDLGATFDGKDFLWRPGYDQQGDYQILFEASVGEIVLDSQTITITVVDVERKGWYKKWLKSQGLP